MSRFVSLPALMLPLLLSWPALLLAQEGRATVELNKLEADGADCRAYLVLENGTDITFETLRLDLVMFGQEGIIAKRLAVDTAPLAAGKTSVKVFAMSELTCAEIGRVLLNGVLACADAEGDRDDCLARLSPESRAGVPFVE
ncbi:Tat pathway signal sequence domain protein [Arhodomonas sp. SL1]|uniref:Tat pathway signal sequence domain protein n=1 Tax=Arhodomonas sp. SL1 TaxID=3425691 RepID=UPI003F8855E4